MVPTIIYHKHYIITQNWNIYIWIQVRTSYIKIVQSPAKIYSNGVGHASEIYFNFQFKTYQYMVYGFQMKQRESLLKE